MPVLLAALVLPLIEIALFVVIGGQIGVWTTLALVLGSAVAGAFILRFQGLVAIGETQRALREMRDPSEPVANGAMLMMAGVLLMIPGFLTDAVALVLLLPPVRQAIYRRIRAKVRVSSAGRRAGPAQGDVIEGEWRDMGTPAVPRDNRPSGWTRH